jgi:hypothetical protein
MYFKTLGSDNIITLSNSNSGLTESFLPETREFILASAISDYTQQIAIDNLVFNLKNYNLWDKMYAIYPFVGGTSAINHKYNLINPQDTNDAYRLVFSGSWTYNNLGVSSATLSIGNFANTFFNPFSSSSVSQNSVHISVYLGTAMATTNNIMGVAAATSPGTTTPALQIIRTTGGFNGATVNGGNATNLMSVGSGALTGFILGNRTASTTANAWLNGNKITTSAVASLTPPNFNIFLGVRNQANARGAPTQAQMRFVSIGQGLTDIEASIFAKIVQTYQIALNRQV